jgi:hypothetical protein
MNRKTKKPNTVVSTYAEVVKLTGYPISVIQAARSIGCPGFEPCGRKHVETIKEWIDQHIDAVKENNVDWNERNKKAIALLNELRLKREEGSVLPADFVINSAAVYQHAIKMALVIKLRDELPPKLIGLNLSQMTEVMNEVISDTCNNVRATIDKMVREAQKEGRKEL